MINYLQISLKNAETNKSHAYNIMKRLYAFIIQIRVNRRHSVKKKQSLTDQPEITVQRTHTCAT